MLFDPPDVQADRDPGNAFPNDDMSRFVTYICEYWDLEPSELRGDIADWQGRDVIVLYPEVLDNVAEPIEWLLMHTIPYRLELTR